jgi:hypothetical protein
MPEHVCNPSDCPPAYARLPSFDDAVSFVSPPRRRPLTIAVSLFAVSGDSTTIVAAARSFHWLAWGAGQPEELDSLEKGCQHRDDRAIMVPVSIADQLLEQRRLRRRAGDSRLSEEGREILLRITTGDLAEEFGRSLDEIAESDPLLSGHGDHD